MQSRRHFIKTAGMGLAGIGFLPVLGPVKQLWSSSGVSFPYALPESQGVSSRGILSFIEAANASGISWHSFVLLRHGHIVAEGWWNPYAAEFTHSLYSLSKSFTSTAIGMLVKEGRLDIQSPVISFFPNDLPADPSPNLQKMTVKHLLTMNTGNGADTLPPMLKATKTWVQTFLEQPVEFAPGTHFLYNTGATYMLGAILHAVTGQTLEQYLAPRLFEPLDITGYDWETSPQGLNMAGFGLRVKTTDIAKLGQLYLQKGKWNGKTLLTESWVKDATGYQTSSQEGNGDWAQGYGYQFWQCRHGAYRGDGAFGQYCIVMPGKDAVLAVTSQTADMQKSLDIIWEHLLPALHDGTLPADPVQQAALKTSLSSLSLPVVKGSSNKDMAARYQGKNWTLDNNDFNASTMQFDFSPSGCTWTTQTADGVTSIRLGWEKWVLNKERQRYKFPEAGLNKQPTKVAGTATWINENTLQLNLRFVETLHGDRIQCVFDGDKLTVNFLDSLTAMTAGKADSRKALSGVMKG
ncbi:serine hydrolase [Chitinophaga sp. OAE865]|uniref:serine hydrolase domain-containing protein n=1 Tax=Chitinophaga sp. OAE865 TaxID=2817898 RepID=UPI001AE87598